eukprot:GDKJ01022074.1.p2 GENE.GDKJ01022074.1~~GDKJ01022074.1.p2  ORF type:complete len:148 (+),score=6.53 GDKJ01022074.1:489-932(+)
MKQMFNIVGMTLGEKLKGILDEKKLIQAELLRRMNAIDPEVDISTLHGAIRLLMKRSGNSSKYLPLIAKALDMSVDEVVNWAPGGKYVVKQESSAYGNVWPFGKRVSREEYEGLSAEQKEIIISRIITFVDENKIKSKSKSNNKRTN